MINRGWISRNLWKYKKRVTDGFLPEYINVFIEQLNCSTPLQVDYIQQDQEVDLVDHSEKDERKQDSCVEPAQRVDRRALVAELKSDTFNYKTK